jgi:hypothetical protein
MVVAYRMGAITAFLLRHLGLVKVRHFSQPNLLAGSELVPEFFQEQASPGNLADALARWLEHPEEVARVQREFARIHESLRQGGAARAGRRNCRTARRVDRARRHGRCAMKVRVKLRVAGVDEAGRGPLAGTRGRGRGHPEPGAADPRPGRFQGARTRGA